MAAAAGFGAQAGTLSVLLELRGIVSFVRDIQKATTGFETLRDRVERANRAIDEIRGTQIFTGGTAAQVGAAVSQAQAIGMEAEQLRDAAHQFRERLFHDPIAIGAFGRSVVPARIGGPANELREFNEAIRMLRATTDAEKRLYLARRLGLEALLPLADLEDSQLRAVEREGAIRGAQVDDELRRLRATEQAHNARLKALRDERDIELERSGLRLKNWFRENIQIPWEQLFRPNTPEMRRAQRTAERDMQTRATQENTAALRLLRREFANAGPQAAGAIPSGLRGEALNRALESHALRLGAFAL